LESLPTQAELSPNSVFIIRLTAVFRIQSDRTYMAGQREPLGQFITQATVHA